MGGEYSVNAISNNMQNLRNYEYMLYGGSNYGTGAPSYANNYMGVVNYGDSYYPYANSNYANGYNPSFNGYGNSYANTTSNSANTNFQGLTDKDWQVLKNYYNKGLSPSQSVLSSAVSGVGMAVMNNPRLTVHPINTLKSLKGTNALFADCKKEGTALYKLWRGKETNGLMQDAYAALNKLEARNFSKIGAFRKRFSSEDYNKLKSIMDSALKSGDPKRIADATATLKNAYVSDGWLAKIFKKPKSVTEAINDTATISKTSAELLQTSKGLTFKQALAKGGGIKGGLFMMGIEFLGSKDKIKTAFNKDNATGWKQVGQTTVKAAGNAAGWALGDAAAVWALGKFGAKIGTAFGPGIGTIIGAVAGVVGGSVGMCIMGKITRALVGQDVGEKIETENMTKTSEGQQKLIQYAFEKAQKGEKMDAATQQVVNKMINLYA